MSLNVLSYSVPDELAEAVAAETENWTAGNKVARAESILCAAIRENIRYFGVAPRRGHLSNLCATDLPIPNR